MNNRYLLPTFIYLLVVSLINTVTCKVQPMLRSENKVQRSMDQCVLAISDKHFPTESTITLTTMNSEVDILSILSRTYKWTMFVQNVIKERTHLFEKRIKTGSYIIAFKREDDLEETLVFLKRSYHWNPYAKFIVTSHNPLASVANIIKIIGTFRILNVIIILPTDTDTATSLDVLNIYTWYPYANGSCANIYNESQLISRCQDGVLANDTNLFPDKIPLDLNGCYVIAQPVPISPYVILPKNVDRSKSNLNLTEGLEIKLLNTIAKAANFKVNYTISTKPSDWGVIYENNSILVSSGLMKLVNEGQVDIGFGCIGATSIRFKYMDYISSHMQDYMTWCVPHAFPEAKWKCVFKIFRWFTWVVIFVTFISSALCLWALAYNRPMESASYKVLQSCITNTLAVLLGISVGTQPRSGHNRLFFIIWIVFSLHLTTSYQTSLISVLTRPAYDKQISTLDELFDSKIPYGFPPAALRYFEDQPDWRSHKVLKEWVPCPSDVACMQSITDDRNYAFAYSRLFLIYNHGKFLGTDGKPGTYIFEDSFVTFPVIIYVSIGFPFTQRIDKLIFRIKEAGLISFWFKELLWKQKIDLSDSTQKLSLHNVEGAFFILGLGLSVSSIVYVIEFIIQQCTLKVKKKFKIRTK